MSMLKCPECGKEVSSKATNCPNCGCPLESAENNVQQPGSNLNGAVQNQPERICPTCGKHYIGNFCPNGCNAPVSQQPAKQKGKKKMKPAAIVAIVIVCVVAFAAIMGTLFGENTADETTGASAVSSTSLKESSEAKKDVEKVIYSDSNVKVSFIKVSDAADVVGVTACYVHLKVENVGSKTFTVALTDAYANNSAVAILSGLPMTLEPGKNSKQPFMFGYNEILKSADEVEKLEFKINLLDENLRTFKTSEKVTVKVK